MIAASVNPGWWGANTIIAHMLIKHVSVNGLYITIGSKAVGIAA